MAIYTPRGMKIRLSVEHAFALMARLYPETNAFKAIKTTEGLELIPGLLASLTGLACFYAEVEPYRVLVYVIAASLAGTLMTTFGVFVVPGLTGLATIFSYIHGYGIALAVC